MAGDVFLLLHERVRSALKTFGISEPTEPQAEAIPAILRGENVLLVAPTASGKTEAALLPVFSKILLDDERRGISALYITPLRALNRDLFGRITKWADLLGFTVEVRHGDTTIKDRQRQAKKPPDILVTTPETLQAILPGKLMRNHLRTVKYVIVDEVHELASDKRGAQLSVGLERLAILTSREFQRIGLSATIGNPEEVAAFIAGSEGKIRTVTVSLPKSWSCFIEHPAPVEEDYELAEELKTTPEAAARIRRIGDLVKNHTSTLVFVNSRTNAEMLGHHLTRISPDIAVHHSSISREEREAIEDMFKRRMLKGLVCTSTMELGVDIGHVDLVIQYLSPRQVSALIQRVGRSGHRLDLKSRGVIITACPDDALESIAAIRLAVRKLVEPIKIHVNALDVLAHQIAGILLDLSESRIDEVFNIVRRAYPYRGLPKDKFLEVVRYLAHLGLINVDGDVLRRRWRTRRYYYENLSMIPDERRYPIIDVVTDRKIGTLGEEFMALRARIGLSFICKGRVWRIVQIEDETGDVYVVPSDDPIAAIPGWDGEMIPVPFRLAQETGRLLEEIAEELKLATRVEEVIENLADKLSVDPHVICDAVGEVDEHIKRGMPLPTHRRIVIEAFDRFLIVHACFGDAVNLTLGCIFDSVLSDHELIVGWWNDSYRILIETPRGVEPFVLDRVSSLIFNLSDNDVKKAFEEYLEARFPFADRMKFVAERFGALPRGKILGPKRLAELPKRFKRTPIYDETLREAALERVDLESAVKVISSARSGDIAVEKIWVREAPSPLAYHILAKYSDLSEMMAPKHVLIKNVDRMRRAIEARVVQLFCISCGESSGRVRVRDIPERPICERCGSGLIACLKKGQDPTRLKGILSRRMSGEKLGDDDVKELSNARRSADLVLSYGRRAIVALQVLGVGPETASRILGKMWVDENEFYIDLLRAKIRFLRTREYWED
ncbi:MAG: DEAD/DEAH box helicase [Nitrososphaerota archaeon]|nr:DEAD/DEAH box helicase [Nitrososphaerota archaeon]